MCEHYEQCIALEIMWHNVATTNRNLTPIKVTPLLSCFRPGQSTNVENLPLSQSAGVAITMVLGILVVANILGNSIVCWIIKKNRDMRYVETIN